MYKKTECTPNWIDVLMLSQSGFKCRTFMKYGKHGGINFHFRSFWSSGPFLSPKNYGYCEYSETGI